MMKTLSIKLPEDLYTKLKQRANINGLSVSAFIRLILLQNRYLNLTEVVDDLDECDASAVAWPGNSGAWSGSSGR